MLGVTGRDDIRSRLDQSGAAEVQGFFPDELISRCMLSAEQLLGTNSAHANRYERSTRVWNLLNHGDAFVELLRFEGLRHIVADVLGESALLSDFSLNCVYPGNSPDVWHRDYPFGYFERQQPSGVLALQCVIPLSPFTVDNGATELILGSQLTVNTNRPQEPEQVGPRTFLGVPGSILLMQASTLHRAGSNIDERPRSAVLMSFVEGWVRPLTHLTEYDPELASRLGPDDKRLLGLSPPPDTVEGSPLLVPKPGDPDGS